ncbi:LysM peptidoglycan-binding domain-containing protein [Flavobacterium orientale]|nr:LysM peptidoglycan-binding domain-containing protein [Flavobacterium orientale]
MKYRLLLFFLFIACMINLFAQEDYVKHKVVKGETVTQIALQYKVTPNDLYELNPKLREGIFENEIVLIPKSKVKPISQPIQKPDVTTTGQPSSNVILHTVQPKETKYGLSKRYGVSIEELERQNPHIVSGLLINHRLEIKGGRDSGGGAQKITNTASPIPNKVITYVVQPKETLYGISRRYGITVEQLVAANKSVTSDLIKIGQTLTIPVYSETGTAQNTSIQTDAAVHIVEKGETKYGLSKRYGTTIEELERKNPHIVAMLQIGHRVEVGTAAFSTPTAIPTQEKATATTPIEEKIIPETKVAEVVTPQPVETEGGFINYEVQPKETMYGLSRMAGISQEKLLELNPQLADGVKMGMTIKLPATAPIASTQSKPVTATPAITGLLASLNKVEKKEIAVLVPLEEEKLNYVMGNPKGSSAVSDAESRSYSDFYYGAKFAIDSIKKMGVQVDPKFYAVNQSNALTIAKNNNLEAVSLVIYPVEEASVDKIEEYLSKNNVPLVSFTKVNNTKRPSNSYVVIPQELQIKLAVLNHIAALNGTMIVVTDPDVNSEWIAADFPKAVFVNADSKGILDVESLKKVLVKNTKNYILMNTDKTGIILDATTLLMKESTNYDIQLALLNELEMLQEESLSEMRFRVLKMIYPSVKKLDNSSRNNAFANQFKKEYNIMPSPQVIKGFDVTFDALVRVFQNKNFEATAKDNETQQVMYRFKYNKNTNGGYSNLGVYLYQFDAETNVKPVN